MTEKRVAVIGGSRNVGRSIAELMHEKGANVQIVARNKQPLVQLASKLPGSIPLVVDAVYDGTSRKILEDFNPDIVVLVAGVQPTLRPFFEMSWEEFKRAWDIDVHSIGGALRAESSECCRSTRKKYE